MKSQIYTFNIDIDTILKKLCDDAIEHAAIKCLEVSQDSDIRVATTIRIDPSVKVFYESLASQMGISLQAIITIVLTGLVNAQTNEILSRGQEKPKRD